MQTITRIAELRATVTRWRLGAPGAGGDPGHRVRRAPGAGQPPGLALGAEVRTRLRLLGGRAGASQYLVLGAKARALLSGRYAASIEDVRALAPAVLQHRILTNFTAEAEGVSARDVVSRLLEALPGDGR